MLLRAACYPLQLDKVSDPDIGKWLAVCAEAGLVRVYPAKDGKRYLQLLDFRQQVRAAASKFPDMRSECVADAQQLQADAHLDVVEDVVDIEAKASHPGKPGDRRFETFWKAYPRKVGKDAARRAFDKRKPDDVLVQCFIRALESQSRGEAWRKDGGQFIPHPATWLNEGRWMDEGVVTPCAPAVELWRAEEFSAEEKLAADEARRAAMASRRAAA
jgi:hypothetical protein